MAILIYRSAKGQTLQVEEHELVKRRILEQQGWRLDETAAGVSDGEGMPEESTAAETNAPAPAAQETAPAKRTRKRRST